MAPAPLRPRLLARTRRLTVRPLRLSDFDAWRLANEQHPPPDSPHDPGPRPAAELRRADFRALLRRHDRLRRADTHYSFGLFDRAEQTLFGLVTLHVVARIHLQLAWLGWRVFGQHRRRGYAREGAEAVIRLAFQELLLHRLEAGIEPDNHASVQLARSLGMRKEGTPRGVVLLRGAWADLDVYATRSEDWGIRCVPTFGMSLVEPRRVEDA